MASDDQIPTFATLLSSKSRRKPPRPQTSIQPLFNFEAPPAAMPRTYTPIVLAAEPAPPPRPILYTVRALIAELRTHVESHYSTLLLVEGEISNCRPAASGHLYFTLKDGDAQLPVVLFRRNASLLGFKPKDGLAVEVRGRISVYETRGQLQLIAESMRPRGTGALQLAYEALKARLKVEGLFDRPKSALPPFPHCIGIVTSPHGAALRDIIHVVRRRHARLNLLIYPAAMQGPQCAGTVAAGIRWFNAHPDRVQLILLARGGGSFEDLNGFNSEALARTIAASALPVVSAIGHATDSPISDFAADLCAPTPSAAAELITSAQHRIEERVASLDRRVHRAAEFHLLRARQRLARLSAEHVLARLRTAIGRRQQRVDELRFRLTAAFSALEARRQRTRTQRLATLEARLRRHDPALRLALARRRLVAAQARIQALAPHVITRRQTPLDRALVRLHALSPLAVLDRGYSIVYLETAIGPALLTDAADALPNQTIRARLSKGSVRATILETQ